MHFITSVEYAGEFKLLLGFEDGSRRLADLQSRLVGEIFQPLRDIAYFKTVRLNEDIDTVCWENGADFSPDFLHEISQPVYSQQPSHSAVAEPRQPPDGAKANR